jgi:hypothetical protein
MTELASWVAAQGTTERVVLAATAAGLELHDVVQMDEFTLDLVVALPDGLWLVYDTT